MGAIERWCVAFGLVYVLLAAVRLRWCWPAGGASAILAAWLSWEAHLPMQAALQVWYVWMAVQGWRRWSQAATAEPGWWPLKYHVATIVACAALCLPLTRLMQAQFAAASPWVDCATTLLSLVATWLTTRMRIESWLYWIAIDTALVWLYWVQALRGIAVLYVVSLVVCLFGLVSWLKQYRSNTSPA